ncbi:MAG: serine hydrolase domain-containing protein [Bacteroidota bacterium]
MLRSLLLVSLLASSAAAQSPPDFSAVDDLIADSLNQIGGGATVFVMQDGEVLHRRGYGTYTTTTVAATASGAKWLSAGVIASLVSDGTLTLDDSLAMFFPTLEGEKRAITVGQMFSHTSGMHGNVTGGRAPCVLNRLVSLGACAEAILDRPLTHKPGAAFDYGSNSMHVAARVAELATGERWVDLFDQRIAQPLGMTDTGYPSAFNPWIAGGMRTTVDDYGAFLQMLLDDGVASER